MEKNYKAKRLGRLNQLLYYKLQRQHFLLSYFKTLGVGPAGVELTTSRMAVRCSTDLATGAVHWRSSVSENRMQLFSSLIFTLPFVSSQSQLLLIWGSRLHSCCTGTMELISADFKVHLAPIFFFSAKTMKVILWSNLPRFFFFDRVKTSIFCAPSKPSCGWFATAHGESGES